MTHAPATRFTIILDFSENQFKSGWNKSRKSQFLKAAHHESSIFVVYDSIPLKNERYQIRDEMKSLQTTFPRFSSPVETLLRHCDDVNWEFSTRVIENLSNFSFNEFVMMI